MKVGIIGTGPGARLWPHWRQRLVINQNGVSNEPCSRFPGDPNLAALVQESAHTHCSFCERHRGSIRQTWCRRYCGVGCRGLVPKQAVGCRNRSSVSSCQGRNARVPPSHRGIRRRPCALVVASRFDEVSRVNRVRCKICVSCVHQPDLGVETAGAMAEMLACHRNSDALQLGLSVRGVIVSRGIAEATRLGLALGAISHTFPDYRQETCHGLSETSTLSRWPPLVQSGHHLVSPACAMPC